jgi:hypothetical protein
MPDENPGPLAQIVGLLAALAVCALALVLNVLPIAIAIALGIALYRWIF